MLNLHSKVLFSNNYFLIQNVNALQSSYFLQTNKGIYMRYFKMFSNHTTNNNINVSFLFYRIVASYAYNDINDDDYYA